MVTFPKGWKGSFKIHSFLQKRVAFFDSKGLRLDEDTTDEEKEITKKRKLDKKIILKEEKISANAVKKIKKNNK